MGRVTVLPLSSFLSLFLNPHLGEATACASLCTAHTSNVVTKGTGAIRQSLTHAARLGRDGIETSEGRSGAGCSGQQAPAGEMASS